MSADGLQLEQSRRDLQRENARTKQAKEMAPGYFCVEVIQKLLHFICLGTKLILQGGIACSIFFYVHYPYDNYVIVQPTLSLSV